ncbi:MAG: hypothetical protein ACI8WB_003662 [Phenylobacterium sp.]|jgi:hypothetical protein
MSQRQSLLNRERQSAPFAAAVSLACILTGLFSYWPGGHSIGEQWLVLFHLFTGVACSLASLPYLMIHLKRTLSFRRWGLLLSGFGGLLLIGLMMFSGWQILIFGRSESQAWVYTLHIVSSLLFILMIGVHLLFHFKSYRQKNPQPGTPLFGGVASHTGQYCLRFNLAVAGAIILLTLGYQLTLQPDPTTPAIADYQYDYGPHPFRPSQTDTPNNQFISQRQLDNSGRCAACHQDIARQWYSSVHRQAASDPSYVTNITLLADKKGIAATRYCEGCHAPIALLTGQLTPGGQHGGIAGTVAHQQGISCMSCHGTSSLTHLKGVGSYHFAPPQDYLFAQSNIPALIRVHDLLIRVKPQQHKKGLGKDLFKDPKFCASCHSQFMDKDMNNWGWVKMQDEYTAWLKSPYSKQHNSDLSNTEIVRCQDCHMPLVNASDDPSADHNGKVRAHNFPGANTFLPLLNGDMAQLNATKAFLQANKLQLSIDKPNRKDAQQTLQALDENLRGSKQNPYYYYLGEQADINIVISNSGVGHDFPGGTIDINQAWVEFLVMDAQGHLVYSSGLIDDKHIVDPDAYFYRAVAVDRQGNKVWKHDLFNMTGESFRRVIEAGKSDIVHYTFNIPSWVKSPLTVSATLKYRKLNQDYAKWALKDQYIEIPVVDMARDSLNIPIKISKEVEL